MQVRQTSGGALNGTFHAGADERWVSFDGSLADYAVMLIQEDGEARMVTSPEHLQIVGERPAT